MTADETGVQTQIKKICGDFESQWQSGDVPRVAEFLIRIDEQHHDDLLPRLIFLDQKHRKRHNLVCDAELTRHHSKTTRKLWKPS